MLTRNKRKRDKNSFLSENLPPRKKRKKISGGASIINQYLWSLFNENKTKYKKFRKKHNIVATDLNNINIILKKIRNHRNDDYDYLKRNLNEGRKPARWNPMLPKEEAATRTKQLIYIAIGFLQRTNETIKDYMEKKNQRTCELSRLRYENFADTHYPKKYEYKRKKVKKKRKAKQKKQKKQITPVPALIQNMQDNLYNTSHASENKQSFLTTLPLPNLSDFTFFNYSIFNKPRETIKPIKLKLDFNLFGNNFGSQNSTPNREDNFLKPNPKEKQFLNEGFFKQREITEFESDLNNLFLT
jgi:hypothetical protein